MDERSWIVQQITAVLSPDPGQDRHMSLAERGKSQVLARIGQLWDSNGTKEEYTQFLSKNPWVWCVLSNEECVRRVLEDEFLG